MFNPYSDVPNSWLKANLHAHTHAWGGLTRGEGTVAEAKATYRALGYDIIGVSNYQQMDTADGTAGLSVYEHGYGTQKVHFLVAGARKVDWMDYPFRLHENEKQYLIDRLRSDGALVIIAHPLLLSAFDSRDLQQLTGYDGLEVASHFGNSEAQWDAALSAGRLVWGFADDDSHNSADAVQTGRNWTMVASETTGSASLINAYRAGHTYSVHTDRVRREAGIAFKSLVTRGDTIDITLTAGAKRISWIGAGGRLLADVPNASQARYVLPDSEPYARAVVETEHARLMFNPVVRTNGGRPMALVASVRSAHANTPTTTVGAVASHGR